MVWLAVLVISVASAARVEINPISSGSGASNIPI
jgi:hypothetical protein